MIFNFYINLGCSISIWIIPTCHLTAMSNPFKKCRESQLKHLIENVKPKKEREKKKMQSQIMYWITKFH